MTIETPDAKCGAVGRWSGRVLNVFVFFSLSIQSRASDRRRRPANKKSYNWIYTVRIDLSLTYACVCVHFFVFNIFRFDPAGCCDLVRFTVINTFHCLMFTIAFFCSVFCSFFLVFFCVWIICTNLSIFMDV